MRMLCLFTRKQLGKLKYLLMCIKETTRIFSPVPMIARTLDKTYEIDGHLVPEGKYHGKRETLNARVYSKGEGGGGGGGKSDSRCA